MKTLDLWDEQEGTWELKLHLGCGDRYLEGYVNIDKSGKPARDARFSDLSRIDIKDYYAGKEQSGYDIPKRNEIYFDLNYDIASLPYESCTVDKIVCIQAFEHITPRNLKKALVNWWAILKVNAPLILSVPDAEATLSLLRDPDSQDFAIRHLVGAMTNQYTHHLSWFNMETLLSLLDDSGFNVEVLPNIHFYPAIVLRCTKRDLYTATRDYQRLPYFAPTPDWKILDVGPGTIPFSLATEWIDIVEHPELEKQGRVIQDISSTGFSPKRFDYVYCSHVFEHLDAPIPALRELMRIGKAGYIEVPSVLIDFFLQHGRVHNKWSCLASGPNTMTMVQRQPGDKPLFSFRDYGDLNHRITQYQIKLSPYERRLREFFWKNQDKFNVSICWAGQSIVPHIVIVKAEGIEQI